MNNEIQTIRELAALLKIGEKIAYTMAQNGELPEVCDQWRFRRADIDSWIDEQVRPQTPEGQRHD